MGSFVRFQNFWKTGDRLSFQRLVIPIAVIAVVTIMAAFASFYRIHVGFFAINGAYQTFNPIQRIFTGQIPGLDFNPYLGIGTTYWIAALAFITGKNFAAVNFINHFWHLFCHFLAIFILFYVVGFSFRRSLLLAAVLISLITGAMGSMTIRGNVALRTWLEQFNTPFTHNYPLLSAWSELTEPGLSNLGLRSTLPFLTSLGILIGIYFGRKKPFVLVLYCGGLIGVQPLWSNDYGIISSLVLFLVSSLYISKQRVLPWGKSLLGLTVSSLGSFLLVGSFLTRGNLDRWLQANILGIAGEQFWYFGFANSKIFELSQLLPEPFLYYYVGLLGVLGLWVVLNPPHVRHTLLLYMAWTTFGAGFVSVVGGSSSSRYFVPTFFVSYFVIGFLGFQLGKTMLRHLPIQRFPFFQKFREIRDRLPLKLLTKCTLLLLIGFYAMGVRIALNQLPKAPNSPNYLYVKTLGGWLPDSFFRTIEIANYIQGKTVDLPPERRILSTYASMIDTLVGSRNATGIDYIIHALGEHARAQYRDRYQAAQPRFITTIRQDYSTWENWVRRVNWWFYREFLRDYEIVDATFYNLIWQHRAESRSLPSVPIQCAIQPLQSNVVQLTFTSDRPSPATVVPIYYLDVTLDYALSVQPSGIPLIGSRGLVNATEVKVATPTPTDGLATYGLPPRHDQWHLPIPHRLGEPAVLTLKGFPEQRSLLQVTSCEATALVPADILTLTPTTTAKAVTDAQWQNGIAIATRDRSDIPTLAGYLATDPMPYGLLIPGMMIEFPQSGVRRVVEMRGNQVWVDGDPLDPQRDGYPNPIRLILR